VEPESSLTRSQKPTTYPYAGPDKSGSHPNILSSLDPFQYYSPIYV